MSGGSFDYLYYRIEETYENQMEDEEMNELLKDFCKVLHDLEWWKSADYGEDTYRKSVKEFKNKWFGRAKNKRITKSTKKTLNLTNKKFGRLRALKVVNKNKKGENIWLCKCDCGNFCSISSYNLNAGKSKSCGCLRRDVVSARQRRHGLTKTSLYNTWRTMITRCDNPTYISYHIYGGSGIRVCDEWKVFENFMKWSLTNGFKEGKDELGRSLLSLARIDNDGNYCPENCRWIRRMEKLKK